MRVGLGTFLKMGRSGRACLVSSFQPKSKDETLVVELLRGIAHNFNAMERSPEETRDDSLHSEKLPAGRRIYFFDVKRTSKGDCYLVISERRRTEEGPKRDRIMVFREDMDRFMEALAKATGAFEKKERETKG